VKTIEGTTNFWEWPTDCHRSRNNTGVASSQSFHAVDIAIETLFVVAELKTSFQPFFGW